VFKTNESCSQARLKKPGESRPQIIEGRASDHRHAIAFFSTKTHAPEEMGHLLLHPNPSSITTIPDRHSAITAAVTTTTYRQIDDFSTIVSQQLHAAAHVRCTSPSHMQSIFGSYPCFPCTYERSEVVGLVPISVDIILLQIYVLL